MPKTTSGHQWEQGFRAGVRADKPGWTVSNVNGRIGLRWRPTDGRKPASIVLPLKWEKGNQARGVLLINQIAKLIETGKHDTLKGALADAQAGSTSMRRSLDWHSVAESLRRSLMEGRNEILPQTWARNYKPYINKAVDLLGSEKSITDGHSLLSATLSWWTGKPASRAACCIALRNLTEHAIARHGAASCWKIDKASIRELKGRARKKRTDATLSDNELLYLIDGIEHRNPLWANVIRLLTLYGLRPVELQYLKPKARGNGQSAVWCSYNKNCGGVLTDPRWLEPCPLTNEGGEVQQWNLAGAMAANLLELPLGRNGEPRLLNGHYCRNFLEEQPEWLELKELCEAKGEWLRVYTFRDSYSLRCHRHGIEIGAVARAMGHSIAVHSRSYPWASTETTTSAFAAAFQSRSVG